ncbi:riboflavin synthase [Metabacillus arenae]|uniref:Riboflavin synthase n=1 Tax=Metabacillus arenae TaxID=2771434 RepID=A0A926RVD1_9BACI|nr:riboflavin synthase [Metabacillus arenae]MBD1378676.1 riboflavin synthase [Metabacillus arenae]
MFTGIIEEIGRITSIKSTSEAMILEIKAKNILEDVKLGDSISVNGVCLTVTSFKKDTFTVDVMPETMKSTSLQSLAKASLVNLERAMSANGRFGGHFVSGHVDGISKIIKKEQKANAVYYTLELSDELTSSLIMKGSIAVDGISLTIFGLEKNKVTISIIPHTHSETVLGIKGIGDIVNIECDMIGKYIKKFVTATNDTNESTLTEDFLKQNGF